MFAFFFDEDHPNNATLFGPQFASKVIIPIEGMDPVPVTRLLTGGLLHDMLVYEVKKITLGGNKTDEDSLHLGKVERAQFSEPNYDRRISIICDLAQSLCEIQSSFTEQEALEHLSSKNIWVIVTPSLTAVQAKTVHDATGGFEPYLGYCHVDVGNPLHRKLFLKSLFKHIAIEPRGLVFRRDHFDDDDDHVEYSSEYGSNSAPAILDAESFDMRFPEFPIPEKNSPRGEITEKRLAGNDPGYRLRIARKVMEIDSEEIKSEFSFSARKAEDGIEFIFPPSKFTHYLLNLNHKEGGPKAKFFIDSLEIQSEDWRYLADQILQGVKKSGELYRLKLSPFGILHGALVLVTGRNGRTAVIETGWRVPEEGPALFVTAYPAGEKHSHELSANFVRVPHPSIVGEARWTAIHQLANSAGMLAAEHGIPTPMVLAEYGTVWEGECGVAWVQLPDDRSSFARWIVEQKHGQPFPPGVKIGSSTMSQSIEKNQAYAAAYAEVLRSNGVDCAIGSSVH